MVEDEEIDKRRPWLPGLNALAACGGQLAEPKRSACMEGFIFSRTRDRNESRSRNKGIKSSRSHQRMAENRFGESSSGIGSE